MEKRRGRALSRREMLATAGASAVVGIPAVATMLQFARRDNPDSQPAPNEPNPENIQRYDAFVEPFLDPDANEIAKAKGITAGEYFQFSKGVLNSLSAFRTADLLPTFPPSVRAHASLIRQLNEEFPDAPEHLIATIMTIESGGDKDAESEAGALGLFQVMPQYHFTKEEQKNKTFMLDPLTNGRRAMAYFTNECLPWARDFMHQYGYDPDHITVFARAMMAYNGGTENARQQYAWTDVDLATPIQNRPDIIPTQSKKYADFFVRFALDAEIAQRLLTKGFSEDEISEKMQSLEIAARAYALTDFINKKEEILVYDESDPLWTWQRDFDQFAIYSRGLSLVSRPLEQIYAPQTPDEGLIKYDRLKYILDPENTGATYRLPFSPGLRIWSSLGGIGLLQKDAKNFDAKAWQHVSTN